MKFFFKARLWTTAVFFLAAVSAEVVADPDPSFPETLLPLPFATADQMQVQTVSPANVSVAVLVGVNRPVGAASGPAAKEVDVAGMIGAGGGQKPPEGRKVDGAIAPLPSSQYGPKPPIRTTAALDQPAEPPEELLKIVQRYDLRRKLNGKNQGLVYGYTLGTWKMRPLGSGFRDVKARYYRMEDTINDQSLKEKILSDEASSSFILEPEGRIRGHSGAPFPLQRNWPELPPEDAKPGSTWVGEAELSVDPKGKGVFTELPLLISYTWKGEAEYFGKKAWEVTAKYAIRYKKGQDADGDPELENAEGTRDAWIYFAQDTMAPLFIRERVGNEVYRYANGDSYQNDGFILTFYQGSPPMNKRAETERLVRDLEKSEVEGVEVKEDSRGISLTLENLRFVADEARLLPGEDERLRRLASVLKTVENRSFLVVGHTADVGSEESQEALSRERAREVVAALVKQGIQAKRLIADGRGSREPAGDNATEEGRAKNRRVEIVILED